MCTFVSVISLCIYIYIYLYIHIYMQSCNMQYAIMKTMCPSGYHHNGIVATHALGHMMYAYTLMVPMNRVSAQQAKQRA